MNGVLGHLCAHVGYTRSETPANGDIALQTQNSKFENWQSDAEHSTSRSLFTRCHRPMAVLTQV